MAQHAFVLADGNRRLLLLLLVVVVVVVAAAVVVMVVSSSCPVKSCDCRDRRGFSAATCEIPTRDRYWVRAMATGG